MLRISDHSPESPVLPPLILKRQRLRGSSQTQVQRKAALRMLLGNDEPIQFADVAGGDGLLEEMVLEDFRGTVTSPPP